MAKMGMARNRWPKFEMAKKGWQKPGMAIERMAENGDGQ
jgi:hypothetical protein